MKLFSVLATSVALFTASVTSASATTLILGSNGGSHVLDFAGVDAGRIDTGAVSPSSNGALPLAGSSLFIAARLGNTVTLDLSDLAKLSSLSFIWGSADAGAGYNDLTVYAKDGTTALFNYTGTELLARTGGTSGSQTDPRANPWVTLVFDPAHQTDIGKLVFRSNNVAFETSNFTLGVPEAATWAMMIVGVGLAGGALRRRGKTTVRYS